MIIEALFNIFSAAVRWIFGLMPGWTPIDLSGVEASVRGISVGNWLAWLNHYLPITHGVAALALVVGVASSTYLVNWALWLLTKLRVIGGGN